MIKQSTKIQQELFCKDSNENKEFSKGTYKGLGTCGTFTACPPTFSTANLSKK